MNKPKVIAYLKPTCGWSNGVRAVLKKYDLPFEDRDIINDPVQRQEMIEKSGQMLSPCVEINGKMLADIRGEEVEAWMLANQIVAPNNLKNSSGITLAGAVTVLVGYSYGLSTERQKEQERKLEVLQLQATAWRSPRASRPTA